MAKCGVVEATGKSCHNCIHIEVCMFRDAIVKVSTGKLGNVDMRTMFEYTDYEENYILKSFEDNCAPKCEHYKPVSE